MARATYDKVLGQPGVRGLYESHYLKGNSPDGRQAFWLKHTVLCPLDAPRVLELWAIVWRSPTDIVVVKETMPASDFLLPRERTEIRHLGPRTVRLEPSLARGDLADDGHRIGWDLRITAPEAPILLYPRDGMYAGALPKSKPTVPAPRARFAGALTVDGERIDVADWVGLRGHNWGREHAHHYAYGNCSLWSEDGGLPALHVDGFSASVKLGPVKTPFLSSVVVRRGGSDLAFNGLKAITTRKVSVAFPRWWVAAEAADRSVELAMEGDPATFVGLRYLHPDGGLSYCYNTKFAHVRLTVRGPEGVVTARAHLGELELLTPEPVPGVRLHGNASLVRAPASAALASPSPRPAPEHRA